MAVTVYIHPQCEEDAKRQGCYNDVLRLKEAILKDQRTTLFDNFPPPYLKKRFTRQQRLIAIDKKINDHIVVCFLRLLIRGNTEYTSFIRNPKSYGDRYFLPLVDNQFLEEWLDKQLELAPPPLPPLPNEIESQFLWSVFEDGKNLPNEIIIYETEEWVNSVQRENFSWRLVQIPLMILEVLGLAAAKDNQPEIEFYEKAQLRIIYKYFKNLNCLCLLDLMDVKDSFSLEEIKSRYKDLSLHEEKISEDDIIRSSLRGYPSLLLADDIAWISIQKDKEANLALSPEETRVLSSAYNFDQDAKHGFPLFINGRAGSGKSTILQYLFSDYLRCWLNLEHKNIEPPLYLTYSGDLVSRSRTVIKSLLLSGFKKALQRYDYTEEDIDKVIPAAIWSFKEYLLELLPENTRTIHFREALLHESERLKIWAESVSLVFPALKSQNPAHVKGKERSG